MHKSFHYKHYTKTTDTYYIALVYVGTWKLLALCCEPVAGAFGTPQFNILDQVCSPESLEIGCLLVQGTHTYRTLGNSLLHYNVILGILLHA